MNALPIRGAVLAVLLSSLLVASCGQSAPDPANAVAARAVATIGALPQDGITLGEAKAPATLTIYTSLDTFNAGFFVRDFDPLIKRYVAPGRLRLQLRTLDGAVDNAGFDAGGAGRAARLAQAVGLQDRLWQFFAVQSAFYAGYVDEPELQQALGRVRGVDRAQVRVDAGSPRINRAVARGAQYARALGVSEAPAFSIQLGAAAPRRIGNGCQGCLVRQVGQALNATPKPTDVAPKRAPTCLRPGAASPATPSAATVAACAAARRALAALKGLPQKGALLGTGTPVLDVYASPLQLSATYVSGNLSGLIKSLVRPGKLRLQLLPRWQRAPERAAVQVALAARSSGRSWDFLVARGAFAGVATVAPNKRALAAVPRLDDAPLLRAARAQPIVKAAASNQAARPTGPPVLVLRVPGKPAKTITPTCATCVAADVTAALAG